MQGRGMSARTSVYRFRSIGLRACLHVCWRERKQVLGRHRHKQGRASSLVHVPTRAFMASCLCVTPLPSSCLSNRLRVHGLDRINMGNACTYIPESHIHRKTLNDDQRQAFSPTSRQGRILWATGLVFRWYFDGRGVSGALFPPCCYKFNWRENKSICCLLLITV